MERQTNAGLTLMALFLGGAVGVGAGYLVSKAFGEKRQMIGGRNDDALNTPYCAVPEGADICYPDQAGS